MHEPSIEEKIDFIYSRLKKEEKIERRKLLLKWGTRVAIAAFLWYMYFFGINMIVDKTIYGVKTIFSENAWAVKNKVIDIYDTVKSKVSGEVEVQKSLPEGFTDF